MMAMANSIINIEKKLVGMSKDISYIKQAIQGNGEPGLIKETRENTNFRISNQARAKVIQVMFGSGWLLSVLLIILSVIGII